MRDLRVSIVQTHLHWESPAANRAMLEEKLWPLQGKTDVILLPEMFTTGFSMEAEKLAEPVHTHTFRWMRQLAQQIGAAITGSFICKEEGKYYNRLLWVTPDGHWEYYDKRHLFRMAKEHEHYAPGADKIIVTWRGWKICPLVCYDLRFPVWSRNLNDEGELAYDLLLYVANWPAARVNAWDILLKARAIENLSYVAGVNRVGDDGLGIPYNGHSAIYTPKGETLFFTEDREIIQTIALSSEALDHFRKKFPAHWDADGFEIKT